jgi:hypothetical protein
MRCRADGPWILGWSTLRQDAAMQRARNRSPHAGVTVIDRALVQPSRCLGTSKERLGTPLCRSI